MLKLIPRCIMSDYFDQKLIKDGDMVVRLSARNITEVNMVSNSNYSCNLILYTRYYYVHRCRYEAGIIYGPGTGYLDYSVFPREMLRIFSYDPDTCFLVANKYYKKVLPQIA